MKRLCVALFMVFAVQAFAIEGISTDHRGYDIPPLSRSKEVSKPVPRPVSLPVQPLYNKFNLDLGVGGLWGSSIELAGAELGRNKAGATAHVTGRYYLNDYVGIGGTLSYGGGDTKTQRSYKEPGDSFKAEYSTFSFGAIITARYPLPRFEPYAAIGATFNTTDLKLKYEYDGKNENRTKNGTAFGVLAEAGGRFHLSSKFNAGLSYRYTYVDQGIDGDFVNVGGSALYFNIGLTF